MQTELDEEELEQIYKEVVNNFEQKPLSEIKREIGIIKNLSLFGSFLLEKIQALNKISFALWDNGDLEKLPYYTNPEEYDFWQNEVLSSLDWKTLQQVLTKLLSEQGFTKQVEESFKYLIGQGWEIKSGKELQTVQSFLETFKTIFPSIPMEETNFRCKTNQFYIELYEKGIIKDLSQTRTKLYIDALKTEDEKASFIEKLPFDKILPYYFLFHRYQIIKRYIVVYLRMNFQKLTSCVLT
ncbi:MAG: hypothetical protein IPN33_00235 [Saprospiraceae bacterium]|nr:hypothetical protein [Saprospiraceae bacterium]